jgi:predicted MFS family arabinose efflux permease
VTPSLRIFWRAFSIVAATAINVVMVSRGRYGAAFVTGGVLSAIWWSNSRTAAHSTEQHAQWVYAFGAACGTVVGMAIGRWL